LTQVPEQAQPFGNSCPIPAIRESGHFMQQCPVEQFREGFVD
jgi:hypothetical protein